MIRRLQLHNELSKGVGNPGPEYGQYEHAQTDGPAFGVFPDRYTQVPEESLHVDGNPLQERHVCGIIILSCSFCEFILEF